MAQFKVVHKKVIVPTVEDIVRFQIISYCFFNRIFLSDLELDCLTQLSIMKEVELTSFCTVLATKRLQKKMQKKDANYDGVAPSSQSVRNTVMKLDRLQLIGKNGQKRKKLKIFINPAMQIQVDGNIMLNQQAIYIDTKEAHG